MRDRWNSPAASGLSRRTLLRSAPVAFAAGPLAGCSSDERTATEDEGGTATATDETETASEPTVTASDDDPDRIDGETRLAAHEFVPVGERRPLGNLGMVLEVIEFDGQLEVDTDAGWFRPTVSGVACIRARYRQSERQNDIQTKCVIGIDETGSCEGLEGYGFDLDRFVDRPGNANWLAHGDGSLYAVCRAGDALRLQSPPHLPPLYLGIVDALGDGAYSIGPAEYERQRRGTIRSYSGEVIEPPWVSFLGTRAAGGTVSTDGAVAFDGLSCTGPECTLDPEFVRRGDVVEIGVADIGSFESFRSAHGPAETEARMNGLLDRHGVKAFEWADIDDTLGQYDPKGELQDLVDEKVKGVIFERLVKLQGLDASLAFLDETHQFRAKNVVVSYREALASVPVGCPIPGDEPQAFCAELDEAVSAAEDRFLVELGQPYRLWTSLPADKPAGRHRPRLGNFEGMVLEVRFSARHNAEEDIDRVPAAAEALVRAAVDLEPTLSIVLLSEGPVSLFAEPGVQCEASYCPSNFERSYRLNAAVIEKLLDVAPDNLTGIAVRTFEGAHFDIRNPVEDRSGYELNRVAETGYNNPLLNVYAGR